MGLQEGLRTLVHHRGHPRRSKTPASLLGRVPSSELANHISERSVAEARGSGHSGLVSSLPKMKNNNPHILSICHALGSGLSAVSSHYISQQPYEVGKSIISPPPPRIFFFFTANRH